MRATGRYQATRTASSSSTRPTGCSSRAEVGVSRPSTFRSRRARSSSRSASRSDESSEARLIHIWRGPAHRDVAALDALAHVRGRRGPAHRGGRGMFLRRRRVSLDGRIQCPRLRGSPTGAARRGPHARGDSGRNLRRGRERDDHPGAHARHPRPRRLRRRRLRGSYNRQGHYNRAGRPRPLLLGGPERLQQSLQGRETRRRPGAGSSTSAATGWSSTAGTCPGPPRRRSTRSRRW